MIKFNCAPIPVSPMLQLGWKHEIGSWGDKSTSIFCFLNLYDKAVVEAKDQHEPQPSWFLIIAVIFSSSIKLYFSGKRYLFIISFIFWASYLKEISFDKLSTFLFMIKFFSLIWIADFFKRFSRSSMVICPLFPENNRIKNIESIIFLIIYNSIDLIFFIYYKFI